MWANNCPASICTPFWSARRGELNRLKYFSPVDDLSWFSGFTSTGTILVAKPCCGEGHCWITKPTLQTFSPAGQTHGWSTNTALESDTICTICRNFDDQAQVDWWRFIGNFPKKTRLLVHLVPYRQQLGLMIRAIWQNAYENDFSDFVEQSCAMIEQNNRQHFTKTVMIVNQNMQGTPIRAL